MLAQSDYLPDLREKDLFFGDGFDSTDASSPLASKLPCFE